MLAKVTLRNDSAPTDAIVPYEPPLPLLAAPPVSPPLPLLAAPPVSRSTVATEADVADRLVQAWADRRKRKKQEGNFTFMHLKFPIKLHNTQFFIDSIFCFLKLQSNQDLAKELQIVPFVPQKIITVKDASPPFQHKKSQPLPFEFKGIWANFSDDLDAMLEQQQEEQQQQQEKQQVQAPPPL